MAQPELPAVPGLSWVTGRAREGRRDVSVSEYKVVNPATNETEREFATATDAEVEQVLERSARAFQSWRTTAKDERAKVLLRVAELYKERIDDLAALITREMGKPTRRPRARSSWWRASTGTTPSRGRRCWRTPRSARGRRTGSDPQGADRPAARHHAVELPLLPGGPLRRART